MPQTTYMRCFECDSILVHWNYLKDGISREWIHDCWACESEMRSENKIEFGIPFKDLETIEKYRGFLRGC